jgi:hypothetical protein
VQPVGRRNERTQRRRRRQRLGEGARAGVGTGADQAGTSRGRVQKPGESELGSFGRFLFCGGQDLIHRLRTTEIELATAKNSWPPWLSKTLSSIKEVANKKDFANFTYQSSNVPASAPSFISHINAIRRESMPLRNEHSNIKEQRRESTPIIKDSQSCSSLKTHH